MEPPGRRTRGRPWRGFMDAVTEDMQEVGVTREDVADRVRWGQISILVAFGNSVVQDVFWIGKGS